MSNKVEPIDTLAEALRKCCGLFNQLVGANTKLLKLQSPDRPIKRQLKGADGIRHILTEDQAVALNEAKIDEQSLAIHKVEDDFLASIKDTDRAIKQHNLAGALGRSMSEPEEWLDELLAEIECMQAAALYSYYPDKNDSASQWGVMTPDRRMGDLVAVQKRLHRLDVMLARRSRLIPPGEQGTVPPKGNDDVGVVDRVAEAIAIMVRDPALTVDEIAAKVGLNRATLYKDTRFKDCRKTLREIKSNSPQRRRDQLPRGEKDADGQIEAWPG